MKILLVAVNAKYIHSNLAVYSLRAYAEMSGQEAEIAEYTINQRVDFILEEIYRKQPDVLVFSCYIWNAAYVCELAEEYRKLAPGVPIWAGGPEVSYEPEDFLRKNPAFTGVMTGEGERTFSLLCAHYRGQEKPERIPGLCRRGDGGAIVAQPQAEPLDLDEIPFCMDDLDSLRHRIIYYESSRGCPFSCSYCLSSLDKKLRFRSLELVFQEIQFFLDHQVPQVKFVDRTFNCRREHALPIWRYIREHDNGVTNFHFEISADLLEEEDLALLSGMRPGLVQFEIGVQTANPETIREIRRRTDLAKLKRNVRRISEMGNIHQHLDLIAGLPLEDFASFRRSFGEVYDLKPQQLQLGFLKILKGSDMACRAEEYGMVFRTQPPYEVMKNRWLSYEDMMRIHLAEEMLEIHYNSGQFTASLKCLAEVFADPFSMYLALGDFYLERGLRGVSQSRIARSERFLEFARSVDGGRERLYREALIFDLYKREKSKSRPSWAADLSAYKKQTAAYLRANGMERSYCHLEPFFGPDFGREAGKPRWVLFDYEHRDELTNEAKVCIVDMDGFCGSV